MLEAKIRGPVFDAADAVLTVHPDYHRFRRGELRPHEFGALVDRCTTELVEHGVPFADTRFAKRYPWSAAAFVRTTLGDLRRHGVVDTPAFEEGAAVALARRLAEEYDHGDYHTYIYPEEGWLLFALAAIVRPANAIFLGSYYGYWAAFAIPPIVERGGTVTLVDPDLRCNDVARRNVSRAGYAGGVRIVTDTGEAFLDGSSDSFDFIVLDAEGPRTHADPGQRGKRVYESLLRHALPRCAPGARLVCHNILLHDATGDGFFDEILARNDDELGPFVRLAQETVAPFTEYASTEGVGVGRWIASRSNGGAA